MRTPGVNSGPAFIRRRRLFEEIRYMSVGLGLYYSLPVEVPLHDFCRLHKGYVIVDLRIVQKLPTCADGLLHVLHVCV